MSDHPPEPCQATPVNTLEEQILNPNVPKNEREWWAAQEITQLRAELAKVQEENKMSTRPAINTHVRLFDLVRYARAELHEDGLITDKEYGWLCAGPMAMSPKGGSPSRHRLEDYDELRANLIKLERVANRLAEALQLLRDHQNGCPLPKYEPEWSRAMTDSETALRDFAQLTSPAGSRPSSGQ